jgi:hypothetical protein
MSPETAEKFWPPELKHLKIDVSLIEQGAAMPLTKDGMIGYELYAAGLQPGYGGLTRPTDITPDPVPAALADREFVRKVEAYRKRGVAVYLGPSATLNAGILTVHSSDAGSISLGMWVPRKGVEVDLDAIPYIRLA